MPSPLTPVNRSTETPANGTVKEVAALLEPHDVIRENDNVSGATQASSHPTALPTRLVLHEEGEYTKWLRGGTTSFASTDSRTNTEASSGNVGVKAPQNWEDVCIEKRFAVETDMERLRHASGYRCIPSYPSIANSGTFDPATGAHPSNELNRVFMEHFNTGKVHPKPPWHYCSTLEDNREHPYYIYWLDSVELPPLEVLLARSRERVALRGAQVALVPSSLPSSTLDSE